MGRKPKNQSGTLALRTLPNGQYILQGYLNGQNIRRRSRSAAELETLRDQLTAAARLQAQADQDSLQVVKSRLDQTGILDAEAAKQLLSGSNLTLAQCVQIATAQVGNGQPVKISEATKDYLSWLASRETSLVHQNKCRLRLQTFFASVKAEMVGEVDQLAVERFLARSKGFTKANDAAILQAFFNFCIEVRKWIRTNPVQVDIQEIRQKARKNMEVRRILTPEQCKALLDATIARDGGNHVPYLILSLWCFIRKAEVERVTVNEVQFRGDQAFINLTPKITKTDTFRRVTVPANMVPLLKECIDRGILTKDPIGAPLVAGWADIREEAGLIRTTRGPEPFKKRIIHNLDWQQNILRHTGVSYFYDRDQDQRALEAQAGHRASVSFKHYLAQIKDGDTARFYAVTGSLTGKAPLASVA